MGSHLKVENLRNTKDSFSLNDISFNLKKGEILLLGGRNGSGKTTLLETICLVDPPTKGKVSFFDKDVFDDRIIKRNYKETKFSIGAQFQGDNLFERLTVMETFELFARSYDVDGFEELIFKCPYIRTELDKKVGNLSAGKTQLTKFLLSILYKPKVVLLDEPVSNIDDEARIWVNDKIRELASIGTSFIITLNEMWEIGAAAKKLITISQGRINSVVHDFDKYYNGCVVDLNEKRDLENLTEKDWFIKSVKGEYGLNIFSTLSIKEMLDKTKKLDLEIAEIRNIKLNDFYPGGAGHEE